VRLSCQLVFDARPKCIHRERRSSVVSRPYQHSSDSRRGIRLHGDLLLALAFLPPLSSDGRDAPDVVASSNKIFRFLSITVARA